VLDLTDRVRASGERGLLGIAFSLDGSRLYVDYTDRHGDTQIEEYRFAHDRARPNTRREILRIPEPSRNHNGGQLASGPDDMLYIGTGDGGVHGKAAQSLSSLHGKILRIDPRPSSNAPYVIPPDNPFATSEGTRGEIWAFGLRNPWRFSFDRKTGDLWIGDVGEGEFEEIDLALAPDRGRAANFGWDVLEGRSTHRTRLEHEHRFVAPILVYSHDAGDCAVIGGFVYRGARIPQLAGAYVYSDYCRGELRWIRQRHGRVVAGGRLDVSTDEVTSLGEDSRGELYVLSLTEGVYRVVQGDS
jgi:glucose/arabinose dehydrogenase